jgi:hypothetical protein
MKGSADRTRRRIAETAARSLRTDRCTLGTGAHARRTDRCTEESATCTDRTDVCTGRINGRSERMYRRPPGTDRSTVGVNRRPDETIGCSGRSDRRAATT